MSEIYLTVEETAERLKLSRETVRRYVREGRLRAVRFKRRLRVPESALGQPVAVESSVVIAPTGAGELSDWWTEPPTPEEIRQRLSAFAQTGQMPNQRAGLPPLPDDAIGQIYTEREDAQR